jgi:dTDP-4-amino-4,6-dideoxygalactose transaminase
MKSDTILALNGGVRSIPEGRHKTWPQVGPDDVRAVSKVLERGMLSGGRLAPIVGLEKEWARRCGVRYCIATNSGTAALHCAVAACGARRGDEVIVPALSFVASAFAVAHQGAEPVFADIDPDTFTIDPASVERLIGSRTRAVMAVHLHGMPADMDALREIANSASIALIEDAAQAHGARYGGRPVGSLGNCAGFSLNATKGLVGGEGGLFVTDSEEMAHAARRLCAFGEDVEGRNGPAGARYRSHALGWNYRCAPLTATLARTQLLRMDEILNRTRAAAEILEVGLADLPGVIPPRVPAGCEPSWNKYRVRLDPVTLGWTGTPRELRDRVLAALQQEGVAAALWQEAPLPAHPAFRRGGLAPWRPGDPGEEAVGGWDESAFPATEGVLASSLLLGSERMPICAQDPELMHEYVAAFAKVIDGLGQLAT